MIANGFVKEFLMLISLKFLILVGHSRFCLPFHFFLITSPLGDDFRKYNRFIQDKKN